jgi:flavin-dependent dehydrogenase
VVLESADGPRAKAGETLPPSVAPLLRELGLDAVLERDGHRPAHGVRAWWGPGGSSAPGENPFLASPHGSGWHVDRATLEARLAEAATAAGADWRWDRRVTSCRRRGAGWHLETGTGTIDAHFVADATGRHARLARRLGARRVRYDRLVGLFALLPGDLLAGDGGDSGPDDGYTVVEAVEDGWWYSARLAGGALAVCRFGDGDLLPAGLRRGDPEAWRDALAATVETRERVAERRPGAIDALPAESSHLDAIDGDGWIALGDAAAAYDPLSSHGIASALGSGYYGGHAVAERLTGSPEDATTARLAYRQVLERTYSAYLDLLRAHYARERRWLHSPFWRRRHAQGFTRAA